MKSKKFYLISSLIIAIIVAFFIYVGTYIIKYVNNPDGFDKWVLGHGILGPIVYILITIIQIIACFIPGEPLELFAGYAYGNINGFIICFIAEAIGSFIVIFLTKKYGMKIVSLFFEKEKIQSLKILKTSKNRFLLFSLLFILPGTPKDLLCYYVGLTDYPLIPLLIITSLGRIPAIITSIVGADALGDKKYGFSLVVFLMTLLLSGIGLLIYKTVTNKKPSNNND